MNYVLSAQTTSGGSWLSLIIIAVIWFGVMYFFMMRPQQKEQRRKNQMLQDLQVGDTVLTTSGFYGVIIDINEDTVIIEFGNNRNCRIPMQREAIAAVEKPEEAV